MPNLTVAVIGPAGYAGHLGKKGTASDITFYNQKRDRVTVTYIEPSRYPEKVSSLFFAVSLADMALLVVDEIAPAFGESVLMLDAAGIGKGYMVLLNYLSPDQVMPLVKGTVVGNYPIVPDDHNQLRETFLLLAEQQPARGVGMQHGSVPVDHHFPVKGVGTVALGGVAEGTIRVHDELRVFPTSRVAHVRSIQKHDDDVTEAAAGDRVGLALKGVETGDLERGYGPLQRSRPGRLQHPERPGGTRPLLARALEGTDGRVPRPLDAVRPCQGRLREQQRRLEEAGGDLPLGKRPRVSPWVGGPRPLPRGGKLRVVGRIVPR